MIYGSQGRLLPQRCKRPMYRGPVQPERSKSVGATTLPGRRWDGRLVGDLRHGKDAPGPASLGELYRLARRSPRRVSSAFLRRVPSRSILRDPNVRRAGQKLSRSTVGSRTKRLAVESDTACSTLPAAAVIAQLPHPPARTDRAPASRRFRTPPLSRIIHRSRPTPQRRRRPGICRRSACP